MKKIFLIISFFFCISVAFSQRVIVFNNTDSVQRDYTFQRDMNIITWNLSMIGRGAFTLEYERKFNDYLSVLGGAGVTYFDPWHDLIGKFGMDDDNGSNDTKFKVGYMFEAGFKFFPKEMDDLDGFYISPVYRHRRYNKTITPEENQIFNCKRISNDFSFVLGWQSEVWDGTVISTFFGIGYAIGTEDIFHTDYYGNKENHTVETKKTGVPLFHYGFSIGIPF